MQIRHILVPTDFGEPGKEAIEYAVGFASKFEAKLTLVHVYQIPSFAYANGIYWPAEDLYGAAKKALDEAAAKLRERWPRTEALLAEGDAWERILNAAKEGDVDLIVMGTHGRRGVARALLGSVAEKVVRMSPIPVLTVCAQAKDTVT